MGNFLSRRKSDLPAPERHVTSLSVVIPALNEEESIGKTLRRVDGHGLNLTPEVIVVDGQSSDSTSETAERLGAQVVVSPRGRGKQLNAGWQQSCGDWVLFVHADTALPEGYGCIMANHISKFHDARWGCFEGITTDLPGWSMRIVEWGVRVRTHFFHMPYGDQAMFVDRKTLKHLNGFDDVPLLEDVRLVQRLRSICPPVILPMSVHTSGRRWKELGIWQTMFINQMILMAHSLGVDTKTLARVYETRKLQRLKKKV